MSVCFNMATLILIKTLISYLAWKNMALFFASLYLLDWRLIYKVSSHRRMLEYLFESNDL